MSSMTAGAALHLQAQANDVDGVMRTKADMDESIFSHDPEVHTAFVRSAFALSTHLRDCAPNVIAHGTTTHTGTSR